MVKEENWGISPDRIRRFFLEQPEVLPEGDSFTFRTCRITLQPVTAVVMGKWPMERTKIRFEGPDEDLDMLYRKFFPAIFISRRLKLLFQPRLFFS